jgi:hypothetical protein
MIGPWHKHGILAASRALPHPPLHSGAVSSNHRSVEELRWDIVVLISGQAYNPRNSLISSLKSCPWWSLPIGRHQL